MTLPLPAWLDKTPASRRNASRRRFLLKLAALYASERGHLTDLSTLLRLQPNTLATFSAKSSAKVVSPRIAHGIEKATNGVVPASSLNDSLL